jgi:hypothetical protein
LEGLKKAQRPKEEKKMRTDARNSGSKEKLAQPSSRPESISIFLKKLLHPSASFQFLTFFFKKNQQKKHSSLNPIHFKSHHFINLLTTPLLSSSPLNISSHLSLPLPSSSFFHSLFNNKVGVLQMLVLTRTNYGKQFQSEKEVFSNVREA